MNSPKQSLKQYIWETESSQHTVYGESEEDLLRNIKKLCKSSFDQKWDDWEVCLSLHELPKRAGYPRASKHYRAQATAWYAKKYTYPRHQTILVIFNGADPKYS